MGWVAVQLDKLPQNMQQKFVPALAAMNWISEVRGTQGTLQLANDV